MIEDPKATEVVRQIEPDRLDISVRVDGMVFNRSLADDLRVGESNINRYLEENPGKTAFWSAWHGKAKVAVHALKALYEETAAEARNRVREEMRAEYAMSLTSWAAIDKKAREGFPKPAIPTETEVADRAAMSPEVKEAHQRWIRAEEVEAMLKAAFTAMTDLRSTLISLSANMRQEMQSLGNKIGTAEEAERRVRNAGVVSRAVEGATAGFLESVGRTEGGPPEARDGSTAREATSKAPGRPPAPPGGGDWTDQLLSRISGGDAPPQPGWHRDPRTGEWVPPEVVFDESGKKVPF